MCIASTDIAAESAESRTVFSIACDRHAALRRHTANSSSDSSSTSAFAVPAASETTENSESRQQHTATCQLRTHSSARQQPARFCKLRKATKTKSYVFLLVILSAILVQTSYATPVTLSGKRLVLHTSEYRERYHHELLQKERERVQPTPHRHHMHLRSVADINIMSGDSNYNSNDQTANGNGNGAEQGYCQTVVGALRKTQKQADTTYQTVRNYLDEYAKHQYQNKTREVYRMWQKHELKLSHPYRDALVRDFDKTPDMSHFAHIVNEPISRSMIVTEMEKVYKTLKTLEQVLGDLLQSRKENESQLRHDYGAERLAFINKYFVEAYRHVGIELEETKQAMMKLKIPVPSFDEPISYNHTSPAKEWLVAVEHLSVMQYLRQLYEVLLSKCAADAE